MADLTPEHRSYLEAFDEYLEAYRDGDTARHNWARTLMTERLAKILPDSPS